MGYTHYWKIPTETLPVWQAAFPQLASDARLIVREAGVDILGPIGEDEISLNAHHDPHEDFDLGTSATTFQCCKTARKEYDVVVSAILLRASQLAGKAVEVRYV